MDKIQEIQESKAPNAFEEKPKNLSLGFDVDGLPPQAREGQTGADFRSFMFSRLAFFRNSKKKVFIFALIAIVLLGVGQLFWVNFKRITQKPQVPGEPGEIVWWGIQHEEEVFSPLIEEFEKKNPRVKIKYQKQSSKEYRERLANALAQGVGPDIFEIHNTWPVMFRDDLSALPSSVMTKEEFAESFYPVIVSDLTLPQGIVGMPLEFDALTLFINEDIFASSARKPPEKWDEMEESANSLVAKDQGGIILQAGVALGITKNVDHWPEIVGLLLIQNRVDPANPRGDLARVALDFYKRFKDGSVWDNALPPSTIAFAQGKLAMYFGPSRKAADIVKANPSLRFRTVRLPQLRKNLPTDPDFSYATYWVHAVSQKSNKQKIAWEFLRFLSTPESLQKLNENISKAEAFGRIYPRPEMNLSLREHPIFGSVILLAHQARSWYLADKTFDGEKGINSRVNGLYAGVIPKNIDERVLAALANDLARVLSSYGVSVR